MAARLSNSIPWDHEKFCCRCLFCICCLLLFKYQIYSKRETTELVLIFMDYTIPPCLLKTILFGIEIVCIAQFASSTCVVSSQSLLTSFYQGIQGEEQWRDSSTAVAYLPHENISVSLCDSCEFLFHVHLCN